MGGHAGSLERLPGRRPASPLEKALWGRAHRQPLQPGLMPDSARPCCAARPRPTSGGPGSSVRSTGWTAVRPRKQGPWEEAGVA